MINPLDRRARNDADLDDEIASHMRMAIADRVARGEQPDAAASAVRREFGSPALVKEVTRAMWRGAWLDRLVVEFRVAVRTLWRTPRFSIAAVACFAIGIGTTATMFSALDAVLLRPLPYPNAERLVSIRAMNDKAGTLGATITPGELSVWRKSRTLGPLAAWRSGHADLTGSEGLPERVASAEIDPAVLSMLGTAPELGRHFRPEESVAGNEDVVILSHDLWRRRFGSDASIIGKRIEVTGRSVQVIGVMPRGFSFPEEARIWRPLVPPQLPPSILFYSGVLGSLERTATFDAARREFARFDEELQASPELAGWTTAVETLRDSLVGRLRKPILLFQAAALLVLLIACANVAALLLARGLVRQAELQLRSALGATRLQLTGHVLVETFTIAAIGGVLGCILAMTGLPLFAYAFPDGIPSYLDFSVRASTLLIPLLVAVIAAIGVSLIPALRGGRQSGKSLHGAPRSLRAASGRSLRILNGLIAAELAMSLTLVVGAALLVTTHARLERSLGFEAEGLLSLRVPLPYNYYRNDAGRDALYRQFEDQVRALPEVTGVGTTIMYAPLDGPGNGTWRFRLAGQGRGRGSARQVTTMQYVTPEYLRLLRVPAVRGHELPSVGGERVAVVNETFARRYFGGDVLGRQIVVDSDDRTSSPPIRIIGIVRDFRDERPPAEIRPAMYTPDVSGAPSRTFLIGVRGDDAAALAPKVRAILRELDGRLVIDRMQSQSEVVRRTFWRERLQGSAMAVCAALAVLLAICGVYGVISYVVAQRTTELGIRAAIGASQGRLIRMVLLDAAKTAALGIVIGLAASTVLGQTLASLLYGVAPLEPIILVASALTILAVAVITAVIPARRAARMDAVAAMRVG